MSLEPPDAAFDVLPILRSDAFRDARLAGRLRWHLLRRATSEGSVPLFGRIIALRQKARFSGEGLRPKAATRCPWLPVGPRNINGRIRCLAVHPTNGDVLYAGAADGGVWKTIDQGQSWRPLTDDQDSLSIGALAIDPNAPDTIYAGTGEPLYFQTLSPYAWDYPGIGVLKSTDGGETWNTFGSIQNQFIYRIAVDPNNSSNILCAGFAVDALANPGAGPGGLCRWNAATSQWDVVKLGVFTDVLFDPGNSGIAYAGKYDDGVWKSTDSGVTWSQRSTGLPLAGSKRISITISRQQPAVLHARVESTGFVFKTVTGAEPVGGLAAWAVLPDPVADLGPDVDSGGHRIPINQRYWCSFVAADPMDTTAEVVYAGGIDLVRRGRDALAQLGWTRVSRAYDPPDAGWVTHSDLHDMAFVPGDSSRFYVATDGGVFLGQFSGAVPPVQWRKVSTGLAVTQFYDLSTSTLTPSMFGGGCQDNGTVITTSGQSWRHIYGGDGSYLAFHSIDPWTIWAVRFAGGAIVQRSKDGGASFHDAQGTGPNRITGGGSAPVVLLAMDPSNPATLFAGTDRIWRTVNGDAVPATSVTWSPRTAAIAPITEITVASSSVIYFGTIDGRLYFSRDGGTAFSEITPPVATGWPANRWLSGITIRPGSSPTMFVTFCGFNSVPNVSNHVWKGTFDPSAGPNGAWTTAMASISSNLPNMPVAALVVDPTTPTTLYVATDVGVFRSVDEGANWTSFDAGLPNVSIVDLAVDPARGLLRAATHGRSMFQRSLAATCPEVDLYVRDNVLDTGEVFLSPSGVPDPSHPGELVYHWQSADIKVDAPPFQPVDALVDGVEFDNPTHRNIPFGPPLGYPIETLAGITHRNPIRSAVNRVYVQAHNRGPDDAADVEVRLLWADAGAGLPPLPTDFWTNFATDSYNQAVWHLIGNQVIPLLAAGVPNVLRFDWTPPATTSDHVCLLALLHCASDSLLPETQLVVDLLTRSNKRVTHRNVHPVTLAAFIGGHHVAWPSLRFSNPFPAAQRFTFRLEMNVQTDWAVAMILPRVQVEAAPENSVDGFRLITLDDARRDTWLAEARASGALSAPLEAVLSDFRHPLVLLTEAGRSGAELRGVRIDAGAFVPAIFVAARRPAAKAVGLRLDVLQFDGDRVVGGSTFLVGDGDDQGSP